MFFKKHKNYFRLRRIIFIILIFAVLFPVFAAQRFVWRYTPGGAVPASPILLGGSGGHIAIFADDRLIHILDSDGTPVQSIQLAQRPGKAIAMRTLGSGNGLEQQQLVCQLRDGGFALVSLETGMVWWWQYSGSDESGVYAPVQTANGYFLVADSSGGMYGVHPRGSLVWQQQYERAFSLPPCAWGGGLLAMDSESDIVWFSWDGGQRRLVELSGRPLALSRLSAEFAVAAVALSGETAKSGVVIFDSNGQIIHAIEIAGQIRTLLPAAGYGETKTVFIHTHSAVYIWLPEYGSLYEQYIQFDFAVPAADGSVYALAQSGELVHIDPRSGLLWQGRVPGAFEIQGIDLLANGLLLTREDRWTIHAFSAAAPAPVQADSLVFPVPMHPGGQLLAGSVDDIGQLQQALNRLGERLQAGMPGGRLASYAQALLTIAAPESGVDIRCRIQAVNLLGFFAGFQQQDQLERLVVREYDPAVVASLIGTLGRVSVLPGAATAIGRAVLLDAARSRDARVGAAAVRALADLHPYLSSSDAEAARETLDCIANNAYRPDIRRAAAAAGRRYMVP